MNPLDLQGEALPAMPEPKTFDQWWNEIVDHMHRGERLAMLLGKSALAQTAYDEGVAAALAAIAQAKPADGCAVNPVLSNICTQGTKSCTKDHDEGGDELLALGTMEEEGITPAMLGAHRKLLEFNAAPQPAPVQAVPEQVHELKTDPDVFDAVASGIKTCEIRLHDRDFKVGDGLLLRRTKYTGNQMHMRPEHCPLEYTGETCRRIVSHVLTGYGLVDRWCILSFKSVAPVAPPLPLTEERIAKVLAALEDAYETIICEFSHVPEKLTEAIEIMKAAHGIKERT